MTVRSYVLIQAEVGKAKAVAERISVLPPNGAKVTAVDTTTGHFDVIVQLEAEDLDKLGKVITDQVQGVAGVQRTTTCMAVRLG